MRYPSPKQIKTDRTSTSKALFGGMMVCLILITLYGLPETTMAQESEPRVFGFENVVQMARGQATLPFKRSENEVPAFLKNISYDQWRDIRFRTEKSLWRADNLPFEIQFFHPGLFYDRLVEIYVIDGNRVNPFAYSQDLFNFGNNDFMSRIPKQFGFAGFRIHYPILRNDYRDEVAVFLGASYFRAVSKQTIFGLSARGVAVDTGLDSGEEFPYFRKFWLVKPEQGADMLTLYALLDSVSLTGAYKFVIRPGLRTQVDVQLMLFARKPVKKLGLAPLTSMYFYGESTIAPPVDDFRPEIHDSDGLLLSYPSGEFVWRPLVNDKTLFINAFEMPAISGFGLFQRDTEFDHYQDLEARYEKRPSTWITPIGSWGEGRVELIQIPTRSEKNDNIVAFWVPSQPLVPNHPRSYRYRLNWFSSVDDQQHALGFVCATRSAAGKDENTRKLVIDFSGGRLADLPTALPADAPLEPVVSIQGEAEIVERQLYPNPPANGWRLVLLVKRKERSTLEKVIPAEGPAPPIEIRAYLKQAGQTLTETWSYAIR